MIIRSIEAKRKGCSIVISIIAMVLLTLGSLTNVVGYQSVKSASVINSPLFRIRTERATNQQQNSFTSQYLGMGIDNNLRFSSKSNTTDVLKKAAIFFKNMDDNTFNIFTNLYLYQLQKKGKVTDVNREKIADGLRHFRDSSEGLGPYKNNNIMDITWRDIPTLCWFPGCQLYLLFFVIYAAVMFFLISVFEGETLCGTCVSHCTNILDTKEVSYRLNKIEYIGEK